MGMGPRSGLTFTTYADSPLKVPMANTFGRRPVVLTALLLLLFSSVWAGLAKTFPSLLAARAFMGIGAGAADALWYVPCHARDD